MANIINALERVNFRYINNIDRLTDDELEEKGYYRGFPCVHGHTIRDIKGHWCYHCAMKIKSNICGFDLNYLGNDFKNKYYRLWQRIKVKDPDECWPIDLPGVKAPHRVCFPSYRTFYSKQKSENVTAHKAIYQCAWGDVGSMVVTRMCGNPWCGNPLHMVSSWNCGFPPKNLHPFDTEFNAEKLMRICKARTVNREQEIITESYKATIAHPLHVKDAPDYDEG
tara:strand:+ start:9758 stop:10429 length:672 start_codon:yes stop_codon:yes gene_type:complete